MSALVFAMVLGAAVLHVAWNALVKINSDRLLMMATIMASQALVAVCFLPFVAFPSAASWPYIWASVALHNGYYLFLIMAYRYGDLSHVYPLARGSSPLIVAVISIVFIGEVLSQQAIAGIAIIAIGIMSLAMARGADGIREPKAILFALGTGVFIAGYTIVDGLGARLAPSAHGYAAWLFALDGIPLVVLLLYRRKWDALKQARRSWKVGFFAGTVSLIAYWIVIWAMTLAPMALVAAVRETSMVFAVLFGVLYLKERLDLARLMSTAVTLAGAVMLKFSGR